MAERKKEEIIEVEKEEEIILDKPKKEKKKKSGAYVVFIIFIVLIGIAFLVALNNVGLLKIDGIKGLSKPKAELTYTQTNNKIKEGINLLFYILCKVLFLCLKCIKKT